MESKNHIYHGYIYLIYDQKYKKIYIGKKESSVIKSKNYYGSGLRIKRILNSRGTFFLKKIILGICYSKEELANCEKECINFFKSRNPSYGYNIAAGGSGGDTMSMHPNKLEIIKKTNTLEKALNVSKAQKGITWENRYSVKELNKKRKQKSISNSGKNNPNYGNHKLQTKESNLKRSKTLKKGYKEGRISKQVSLKTIIKRSKTIKEKRIYKGKNNPMYGKCAFDIWIEKFGLEIATQKKLEQQKKRKETMDKKKINYKSEVLCIK